MHRSLSTLGVAPFDAPYTFSISSICAPSGASGRKRLGHIGG
jgi:hypothetical protein